MPATAAVSLRYAPGNPTYTDILVGPNGNDETGDGSRARPLRTIRAAWRRVPHNQAGERTGAYRIRLLPGEYAGAYLDRPDDQPPVSAGTAATPLAIESDDPDNRARIVCHAAGDCQNLTLFRIQYVYLQNFDILMDRTFGGTPVSESGDALQCDGCSHLLVRNMQIRGIRREAQTETVKLNQAQHVYIEDSDISGAGDNALDAVAVQYGHIVGNRIHNANDWCAYVKGGSAELIVEGNRFDNCGTGGFVAGQGTGFQFMVSPWLHYEAYDIRIVNNLVSNVEGAGMGVNGGYNILIAYNTMMRVGQRSHMLEFLPGRRGCDGGDAAACQPNLNAGGWGTIGGEEEYIPNRNIFVYNNIIYNPPGSPVAPQIFSIRGPYTPPAGYTPAGPNAYDTNLQIRGNIIWSGDVGASLGIEDAGQGCQATNPTCNAAQLTADNRINTLAPQLVNVATGDLRPLPGGSVFSVPALTIPPFPGGDSPAPPLAPPGDLANLIVRDYDGIPRAPDGPPGAYTTPLPIVSYVPQLRR
jgi:hypothetical protein